MEGFLHRGAEPTKRAAQGPDRGFCTPHALAAAVPLVCETQERLLRRLSAAEQIALQELVDRVTA